jgi:5-(carboxyamino)imidazole ribonucleotide synthase
MIPPGETIGISGRRPAWPDDRDGGGAAWLSLPHLRTRGDSHRRRSQRRLHLCRLVDRAAMAASPPIARGDLRVRERAGRPARGAGPGARLPHPRALETAQDRLARSASSSRAWRHARALCAGRFATQTLPPPSPRIGAPGILKTRRDGYDGKGQWRIMAALADADQPRLADVPLIYEGFVTFCRRILGDPVPGRGWRHALLGQRRERPRGRHPCALDRARPPAVPRTGGRSARAGRQVAEALGYVGVLTLEFFATDAGPVFNEMAPRVHNSGHWTIEGALTSQFENHVRAICGLPLGDTALAAKGVEMKNLIGDEAHDWPRSCPTRPTTSTSMARRRRGPAARWATSPGWCCERPMTAEVFLIYRPRRQWRDRARRHAALAHPGRPQAVQGADHGQADDHGPQDLRSLPGLLPGRRHIVLTRDCGWQAEAPKWRAAAMPRWRWPATATWR